MVSVPGLRGQGKPTLANSQEQEILINPFLSMCQAPGAAAVRHRGALRLDVDTHAFAALRQ